MERAQTGGRRARQAAMAALAVLAGTGVAAALLLRDGDTAPPTPFERIVADDPGPVHVHGLGIDPADGALYIATHTGLYRAARGERRARRVGTRYQDTMGFAVAGPNRFLGSGHPDVQEARERGLPPLLGLIESTDAGRTWRPISLLGEADFHVLRFAGSHVYGYDASHDRLLASRDRGRSWAELPKPGPIVDLAVAPDAPRRLVATTAGASGEGLHRSSDGGASWTRIGARAGLLAWPAPDRLYLVGRGGRVFRSADAGSRLEGVGEVDAEAAAFLGRGDDLYVALHDGTIVRSGDGGATWSVRSAP